MLQRNPKYTQLDQLNREIEASKSLIASIRSPVSQNLADLTNQKKTATQYAAGQTRTKQQGVTANTILATLAAQKQRLEQQISDKQAALKLFQSALTELGRAQAATQQAPQPTLQQAAAKAVANDPNCVGMSLTDAMTALKHGQLICNIATLSALNEYSTEYTLAQQIKQQNGELTLAQTTRQTEEARQPIPTQQETLLAQMMQKM